MKSNSEYTFIFPEILIKAALCLMMQSLNQPALLVHVLACCWLLGQTVLSITYYIFLSSEHLRFFLKWSSYNTKLSPFKLLSSSKFCWIWLRYSYMWEQMQMSSDTSINKNTEYYDKLFFIWNYLVRKFLKMLHELQPVFPSTWLL